LSTVARELTDAAGLHLCSGRELRTAQPARACARGHGLRLNWLASGSFDREQVNDGVRDTGAPQLVGVPRLPARYVARDDLRASFGPRTQLTVVRGPAGSGKRALVAGWARSTSEFDRVLWIPLEPQCDRERFWQLVADRLASAGLSEDVSAARSPDELRTRARHALHRAGEVLLVLGSFERTDDAALVDDLIALMRTHPALDLVVLSRSVTAFERRELELGVEHTFIEWPAFAFTVDDVARMLALHHADGDAVVLHRITGGLPAAVRLAIRELTAERTMSERELVARLVRRFQGAVLGKLRTHRDFAAHTAAVGEVTEELARTFAGSTVDVASVFGELEREGLGGWRLELTPARFTYPPIVRQVVADTVTEAARRDLQRTAAAWHVRNGDGFTAFALAVESGDLRLAAQIQARELPHVLSWNRDRLRSLLAAVPPRLLKEHPTLLGLMSWALYSDASHRSKAIATFAYAADSLRARRDADANAGTDDRLLAFATEAMAWRMSGNLDAAISTTSEGRDLVGTLPSDERSELAGAVAVATSQFGLALLHAGRLEEAISVLESGWDPRDRDAPYAQAQVGALLAASSALFGAIGDAERVAGQVAPGFARTSHHDPQVDSMYHLARAVIAVEHLDYPLAQSEIVRVAPLLDVVEHWPFLATVQARIDLATGHPAASLAAIDLRLRAWGPHLLPAETRIELATHESLLFLAAGRIRDAEEALRGCPAKDPRVAAVSATGHLLADDAQRAYPTAARELRQPGSPLRVRAWLLAVATAAAIRLQRPNVDALIDELSVLTVERGLVSHLTLLPGSDLTAIRECLLARPRLRSNPAAALVERARSVLPDRIDRITLTPRETVVLERLAELTSFKELAETLYLSPNTVKSQVRSIYRKLGVNSRDEALEVAREHRLLRDPSGARPVERRVRAQRPLADLRDLRTPPAATSRRAD
jgi:LuxR family maltose regulon positive regulatory protein